jgi:short-chain Z-isoprenyl diphosphate synthase
VGLLHRAHTSAPELLPVHVGVVMDGNRRWAKAAGHASPSAGHRQGADHVKRLLEWCADWGIDNVTVFVLSVDNIRKRSADEVGALFGLLNDAVPRMVTENRRWALHVSGDLGLVPAAIAGALRDAESRTAGRPAHFTMAIGYDGRAEIVTGIRGALATHGAAFDVDAITASLPGGPVKDIDLVIRTSGERRLSGFMPWQITGAEIFVSPKMWPAFTSCDFTAALRHYSDRALARNSM